MKRLEWRCKHALRAVLACDAIFPFFCTTQIRSDPASPKRTPFTNNFPPCEVCIRILSNLSCACRRFTLQWRDVCAIADYALPRFSEKRGGPFEAVARWGLCGPFTFGSSHITLHYLILPYLTLPYITLHCIILPYLTLHYITYIT